MKAQSMKAVGFFETCGLVGPDDGQNYREASGKLVDNSGLQQRQTRSDRHQVPPKFLNSRLHCLEAPKSGSSIAAFCIPVIYKAAALPLIAKIKKVKAGFILALVISSDIARPWLNFLLLSRTILAISIMQSNRAVWERIRSS